MGQFELRVWAGSGPTWFAAEGVESRTKQALIEAPAERREGESRMSGFMDLKSQSFRWLLQR